MCPGNKPIADALITLQAKVCGCISAHPRLRHQKTKRETSNAWKRLLHQASWNVTVLKFEANNPWEVHSYLSRFFVIYTWSHDLEQVTS